MDRQDVLQMISEKEHLNHSGIKGQKWGVRRFQNEDGSLTPEGRRRYGLKSDYSNMTDQQLRDAINKKRTQNQYVDIMTKDARKKKEDIAGFIRSASDVAGKSIDIIDKTALDKQRSLFDEQISDYKEVKDANQKLLDKANSHNQKIDNAIEKNKRLEAAGKPQKDLTELGNKVDTSKLETAVSDAKERQEYFQTAKDNLNKSKDLAKTSTITTGQSADMISKLSTKGEIQEKTAEAIRNIQEMDEDQLKKTVDRIMLEKQYDELINPPKPSAWARGREIMQSVGSALGIILSIVTIASIAKGLKSKGVVQSDENGEFLSHYRTPGSKNGVRRYQNEDGTLTPEGYRHYGIDPNGRQAADPRAIIERQRAQIQAQRMQQKAQVKQNAYTQKIAQRQALREARNQSRIQNVYAQQQLREQRAQNEEELRAKAENRENIRKNVIKGVAATAAIVGAVMIGRHILKERALNAAHMRDMEKTSLLGKQRMAELTEQNKLGILKENNAANAMKESIKNTPTNVEIPKSSIPKVETPITPKKSNDDIFKKTKKEFKEIKKSQKGWIADSGLNLEKEGEASLAALKQKKVYNAPVAEAYKIYEPQTGGYIIKRVKSLIHSDNYIAIWEIGKIIFNRCFLIEQKS